jgi:glycosyltransferase involved in cell wall biosynthesis
MPTYNNGLFLVDAIESILNQTFPDFEFIIFDDGSTDNTSDILDYYRFRDKRIKILKSKINYGRGEARNRLIHAKTRSDLIAIMDSDDISMPNRFEKQIDFLDQHPDIHVLGTQVVNVDEDGHPTINQTKLPLTHGLLAWSLTYSVPFCNPSVMLRCSIIDKVGLYKLDSAVEDADYWARSIFWGRFANLSDVLLQYRMPESRLVQRMSDWDIPLRQVNIEFIEKITHIATDLETVYLIRQSMYRSKHNNLSSARHMEALLIIQKIFSNMFEKNLLLDGDRDELLIPIIHQIKTILDLS